MLGIFADNLIEVAKRELAWEVDYIRESNCAKIFRKLLENHPDYYVPEVIGKFINYYGSIFPLHFAIWGY